VHGGDNDLGNLIVSECLPETSRPAIHFSDDYTNINYVNKSNESGSFLSHASGVHSVEMKSVWCNIERNKLLWNDSWFFSIVTVWRFCPLQWLFSSKQRGIMLGSIELINSINKHISVMKEWRFAWGAESSQFTYCTGQYEICRIFFYSSFTWWWKLIFRFCHPSLYYLHLPLFSTFSSEVVPCAWYRVSNDCNLWKKNS